MMPVELTTDLQQMVDTGDITREQAERVMSESRPSAAVVDMCGQLFSKGTITSQDARLILSTIQQEYKRKQLCEHMNKTAETHPLLKRRWPSRQHAIDDIKYHSTRQGRQVLVNKTGSRGNMVTMMCASALSKGRPKKGECNCNFRVVLRRTKRKEAANPWSLKEGTKVSDLQHSVTCTSQGRLTFRELKMNLKPVEGQVLPTIAKTKDRIARHNKVPHSFIPPYVAARTRLEEAKQTFADYSANWTKLDKWAQQLKERNPGSVVHVDIDEATGHFERMFVGLHSAEWVARHTGAQRSHNDGQC